MQRSGGGHVGGLHGGLPLNGGLSTHFYDYTAGGTFQNGLLVVAYELADVGQSDGGFGCVPGSHKSNIEFPIA